jgi:FtsH-binding integral membrane protein
MDFDAWFPTLFSKTFFILSVQLFITWATTQLMFSFLKHRSAGDPAPKPEAETEVDLEECNPRYLGLLQPQVLMGLVVADIIVFLILLFWGSHQSLAVSMSIFGIWSVLTGLQLEFILLTVDHGLGRRVLMLTSVIVLATGLVGVYSKVDFGFLQIPLFLGLSGLIGVGIYRLLRGMSTARQRAHALSGVILFTMYLVFDFNMVEKKQTAWVDGWPAAMQSAISIYLDIINLILHLLDYLSKSHN